MHPLIQLLLTVAVFSIMGATVGLGVAIADRYPQLKLFVKTFPVIGWALVFAAVSLVSTVVFTILEYFVLWLLS